MTRSPELHSVNCTSCGAGLDIYGGGRVTTHICPYCGAELDANNAYRVLRKFNDLPRPETPFSLGDTGTIKGVRYTVIGTLGMQEWHQDTVWKWVEHQVFSETHGYAWLNVEKGHVTFSRRLREDFWMSEHRVETSDSRPTVAAFGKTFRYYETTNAKLTFAEGEFSYVPVKGTMTKTISALTTGQMLEFSVTNGEREIHLTEYLSFEDLQTFKLAQPPKPRGVIPVSPVNKLRHGSFLIGAGSVLAFVSFVLAVALGFDRGALVRSDDVALHTGQPQTIPIEITDTGGLTEIHLTSAVQNGWIWIEAELTDPEGETRFETGRISEHYSGRDADGSWTETNRASDIRFLPDMPGTYELTLSVTEAAGWTGGREQKFTPAGLKRAAGLVRMTVYEGQTSGKYLFYIGILFSLVAGIPLLRRYLAHKARWFGSDWSDD
ncbi:DUF4178 domain-containing protein [Tropicibacter naphthalenivorans]|uniref:DUF4178 domain-containing protein n=1 Tax=Tropicibacter naphthalenivorans TaxID=441103 RepID=A0A0P1GKG5_9RHOB|nr:DUF4178 domain-containing protein [Tropicibacter naphthalenivorans]CUH82503.1 hypothetical protein TRN7648_04045 [Tropicibacter naphthalenivorans]SMD06924.1 protein of unknown function [Tropicibacter naphthalenivorans]